MNIFIKYFTGEQQTKFSKLSHPVLTYFILMTIHHREHSLCTYLQNDCLPQLYANTKAKN